MPALARELYGAIADCLAMSSGAGHLHRDRMLKAANHVQPIDAQRAWTWAKTMPGANALVDAGDAIAVATARVGDAGH
jgi:hypothetical protein